MKFIHLVFYIFFFCSSGFSQSNNGYYGKKAFIQVESLINTPFFTNVFKNSYPPLKRDGSVLRSKSDKINVGYRINIGYALQRNFAVLFEYGQDFSSVYPYENTSIEIDYNYYYVDHEMVDLITSTYLPKLEFSTSNALLPMGLSHQLGIGVALTKVQEKNYMYQISDSYSINTGYILYEDSETDIDPIDFSRIDPIKKIVIMYGLSMRTPLTKSLMIHYGLKYTLNVGRFYGQNSSYGNPNSEYTNQLIAAVYRHRLYSFINANIGLTFAF